MTFTANRSMTSSFGLSLAGHVVFLTALWLGAHYVPQLASFDFSKDDSKDAFDISSGEHMLVPEVMVFKGISYADYLRRQNPQAPPPPSQAQKLLGQLQGLKFSNSKAVAKAGGPTSALGNQLTVAKDAAAGGEKLTKLVANQDFAFNAGADAAQKGRKMTDKERAELKQKFRVLEGEFRKIYAKALQQDPHMEVTVSFEAQIQPSGYLSVSNWKTRGTFQADTMQSVKSQMAALIAKVFVAKDLSGSLVRGESVFVR